VCVAAAVRRSDRVKKKKEKKQMNERMNEAPALLALRCYSPRLSKKVTASVLVGYDSIDGFDGCVALCLVGGMHAVIWDCWPAAILPLDRFC